MALNLLNFSFSPSVAIFVLFIAECSSYVPMTKLPWNFSPKICLPMSDPSYDPFGINEDNGLLEETTFGSFGAITLYCRYGCCGDTRNPVCCDPSDEVSQGQFEVYKLVAIVAAGIAGLCIVTAIILMCVKSHMKKRRLIRDIQAINRMNNMTGIASVMKDQEPKTKTKPKKLFKNKKKPIPVQPMEDSVIPPLKPILTPVPPKSTDHTQPSMINGKINIPDKPVSTISYIKDNVVSTVDYGNDHYKKTNIFQPPPPPVYKYGYANGFSTDQNSAITKGLSNPPLQGNEFSNGLSKPSLQTLGNGHAKESSIPPIQSLGNGHANGLIKPPLQGLDNGHANRSYNLPVQDLGNGLSSGHANGLSNSQPTTKMGNLSTTPKASELLKNRLDGIIMGDQSASSTMQAQNEANQRQEEKASFKKPNPFTGQVDSEWGSKSNDPIDDLLLFLDKNPADGSSSSGFP